MWVCSITKKLSLRQPAFLDDMTDKTNDVIPCAFASKLIKFSLQVEIFEDFWFHKWGWEGVQGF